MAEYCREQRNQLSRGIANSETGGKQLKGFADNRPGMVRKNVLQHMLNNYNRIKQYKSFDENTDVGQLVAVDQNKSGSVSPIKRLDTKSYYQYRVKSISCKENIRNTISGNLAQMKIAHNDTIGINEKLQHGSNVKTFTTEGSEKAIQVPNGPAWFTLNNDEGLLDNGTLFNLHAALLEISGSGKIYVHKLTTANLLNIITFENHEDAKSKLREDKIISSGLLRICLSPLLEDLLKEMRTERYPMANNKIMAGKMVEQSEASVKGYRYNKDLIRGEPEVVIYKPEDDVIPVAIVEYDVSEWEGSEIDGYSRSIVPTDGGDSYKQVSREKNSSICNIVKI